MDITRTFKATIKAVRTTKKLNSGDSGMDEILKDHTNRHNATFRIRSKEIVKNITKLKDAIIEHGNSMVGINGFLASSPIKEREQEKVDEDIQFFMKSCSKSIFVLKSEISAEKNQLSTHRKGVVQLLEEYLRAVCKIFGQQKAIRVKRAVDRKKMSRLSTKSRNEKKDERKELPDLSIDKPAVDQNDPTQDNLSKEEIQMFEEENKILLNELNDLVDEVKQIEGKVIEISQLQEIFSEKVLDQASQIEKVNETTISTTENVKEGNENIREAIKNSATFRVWILFFLVMCTFSLLFLDWYNV